MADRQATHSAASFRQVAAFCFDLTQCSSRGARRLPCSHETTRPIAWLAFAAGCSVAPKNTGIVATYSIVAFDPKTDDLGVAVQSKSFGVGSVVPHAKANVGAVATEAKAMAMANVTYGPRALKLLEDGKGVEEIANLLRADDADRERRQLGIVDAKGNAVGFTGSECFAFAGHRTGENFTVQGNILAGKEVIDATATAFESAQKTEGSELADWLVAALQAGEDAGGDKRGRQSAALLVAREKAGYGGASDRYIDLRVEDHPDPTHELARLLKIHKSFYAAAHRNTPKRETR